MKFCAHPCLLGLLFAVFGVDLHGGESREAPRPPGDQMFRIIQTTALEFPVNVDTMGLTAGEARIIFNIDAEGRLADYLIASYTQRAFADEAVRALKEWRYEPALQYGEPIGVRAAMIFRFEAKGKVVSVMGIDSLNSLFDAVGGTREVRRVAEPDELDTPPQAIRTVNPRHPARGERSDLSSGRVLVDFYLDDQGRPRMPVVMETDDPAFSVAAVNALMNWRFTVPTRKGEPVAVRVKQVFEFGPRVAGVTQK